MPIKQLLVMLIVMLQLIFAIALTC
ncbi:hypothetical protein PTD2_09843 [Pseudoalteromonas tunicata D2]|uniref:Uncharacterized protein n=1 Tax=Pseudoalteromonas tunicata D2 TaxID=87626 RepID=A4CE61_9GAMM|nr:hypothetical protein PTD2_09843 [Pseudoalteromonas tunicata D2]